MDSKTKKANISIPINMDEPTAQQCFLLGLRAMTNIYNSGVVVNYAMENKKGIENNVFFNKEAGAIIDFVNAMQNIHKNWDEIKKELEVLGNDKLAEIVNQKINSPVSKGLK